LLLKENLLAHISRGLEANSSHKPPQNSPKAHGAFAFMPAQAVRQQCLGQFPAEAAAIWLAPVENAASD
jgi:hypothetical protein